MYNEKNEFDNVFEKGFKIGLKLGYIQSEIDEVYLKLFNICNDIQDVIILQKIKECNDKLSHLSERINDI